MFPHNILLIKNLARYEGLHGNVEIEIETFNCCPKKSTRLKASDTIAGCGNMANDHKAMSRCTPWEQDQHQPVE